MRRGNHADDQAQAGDCRRDFDRRVHGAQQFPQTVVRRPRKLDVLVKDAVQERRLTSRRAPQARGVIHHDEAEEYDDVEEDGIKAFQ